MNEKLFRSVQAALLARWDGKLSGILVSAKNFALGAVNRYRSLPEENREVEVEKLVREAYLAGYRQAYWDGIVDFVEVSSDAKCSTQAMTPMTSVVH